MLTSGVRPACANVCASGTSFFSAVSFRTGFEQVRFVMRQVHTCARHPVTGLLARRKLRQASLKKRLLGLRSTCSKAASNSNSRSVPTPCALQGPCSDSDETRMLGLQKSPTLEPLADPRQESFESKYKIVQVLSTAAQSTLVFGGIVERELRPRPLHPGGAMQPRTVLEALDPAGNG